MTQVTRMTQNSGNRGRDTHVTAESPIDQDRGPMRTLKVGDRITVYGDLELVAVEGRRATVRVRQGTLPVLAPIRDRSQNFESQSLADT